MPQMSSPLFLVLPLKTRCVVSETCYRWLQVSPMSKQFWFGYSEWAGVFSLVLKINWSESATLSRELATVSKRLRPWISLSIQLPLYWLKRPKGFTCHLSSTGVLCSRLCKCTSPQLANTLVKLHQTMLLWKAGHTSKFYHLSCSKTIHCVRRLRFE